MKFVFILFLLAACSQVEQPAQTVQEAPQEVAPPVSPDSCKSLILSQQPSLTFAAESPDRASPLDVKRYTDLYGLCVKDPEGYQNGDYMILESLPKE